MQRPPAPTVTPPRHTDRARAVLGLIALLLADAAALALLVSLGGRPPFDLPLDLQAWADAEPADALAAALRWVALGAAAWLLAATLLAVAWALAVGRGRRPRRRLLAAVAVPRALRLLAEQALVGGLALGVSAVPAVAQAGTRQDPPAVTVVRDGRATDLASLPGVDTTTATAPPGVTITSTAPVAAAPLAAPEPAPAPAPEPAGPLRVVVVAPGEHLWALAAREVARVRGVPRDAVADAEIAPYWLAVCDANRGRLASGDVNLLYPGESVVLPPIG